MDQQKELNRLRHLVLGEDEQTIAKARQWFKKPDYQSRGMSEVLAEAIKIADQEHAEALSIALKHPVEKAVKHTLKNEPHAFSKLLPLTILPMQERTFLKSMRLLLVGIFAFVVLSTASLGFLIYQSTQTSKLIAKLSQKTELTRSINSPYLGNNVSYSPSIQVKRRNNKP